MTEQAGIAAGHGEPLQRRGTLRPGAETESAPYASCLLPRCSTSRTWPDLPDDDSGIGHWQVHVERIIGEALEAVLGIKATGRIVLCVDLDDGGSDGLCRMDGKTQGVDEQG